MKKVLVIGANGQLGRCIRDAAKNLEGASFLFEDKDTLDITNKTALEDYFKKEKPTSCINTAAYTDVEKAESEEEMAFLINAEGAKNVAEVCKHYQTDLWHISTDYVFDGTKTHPYVETDPVNPINKYGASKLKGEEDVQKTWERHFIIRTSWLYSQYGHNFYKSMVRLAKERDRLTITTEQLGVPTNANDLARAILELIGNDFSEYGLYHFSNLGAATWFDFAKAIVEAHGLKDEVSVDSTDYYPTFAKRPKYSVLDVSKINKHLTQQIPEWQESLQGLVEVTTC